MISISIDQAMVIIRSLKLYKDATNMSITDNMSIDQQTQRLEISIKIDMMIKDIQYKLSNEILNS